METMEIELQPLDNEPASPDGDTDNNNFEMEDGNEVNRRNGNHLEPDLQEQISLLPTQGAESNGVTVNIPHASGGQEQKPNVLKRLKKELNEPVFTACGKIKLWMAFLFLLVLIISVILLILFLCSGHTEDADDKYDRLSFVTSVKFTGSFRLQNSSFVHDLSSNDDRNHELFTSLKQKLTHIYTTSPTLERYFSLAKIETMRPKNTTVIYELVFMMPEEHEEHKKLKELKRYILSREMVYNVLRQNLLDQDTEDELYIEPSSLIMERMDN